MAGGANDPNYKPRYHTIDWANERQYWKPGALDDLKRVSIRKKKSSKAKRQPLSNRLSAGARVDVWRHQGEMSGQR